MKLLEPRNALLAGATGLIGQALLRRLVESLNYARVHALVRRAGAAGSPHPKLVEHIVDFSRLPPLPAVDDAFIALGTTIGVAGSQEAFRKVDFDAVVDTAKAARAAGAKRVLVVSALGADANSRVFYNRVKGDMQAAVVALGFESVVFAQPSLLIGDRARLGQPVRRGEVWGERLLRPVMRWVPRAIRPIAADDVAAALIEAALDSPPGTRILSSKHMLGRGNERQSR